MHPRCVRLTAIWLVGAALVVTGAASAAPQTRLVISGAFHTTSARTLDGHDEGCGFRTKGRTLLYQSDAMRIGLGKAVARVTFTIPRYHGRGRYDARIPAPYGRTAVQVVTSRNATTGVASGFYIATSGEVAVLRSKNVGRLEQSGSVSGTVRAGLRLERGWKRLRLEGSWLCRIDPTSNGG
jgi:hypothetical protein